ncbi:PREDICTED: probable membrane-associated kinase regulator 2 [Fragaria vesca subsp. vesca]|uniref:probable membrane-associated kinase regulator 2 n=1 Tax=Fragaria vesca subsp. vesca TaxID=101020 RepID=UPI0002C34C7B|nr:PREDICTED: probable membrane-associated kinase regulator 2 [Fragaria vesca subsp. vesca]
MEAFSLLKYWRGGGLVASTAPPLNSPNVTSAAATILTAVAENCDESHATDEDDDDGPFFDLEFSAQEASGSNDSTSSGDESDEVEVEQDGEDDESDDVDGEEGEFNFAVSSGSSNDRTDPNLTMSPTDDLFFKGKLVPIEPDVFNSAEPNSKALFSESLLKSATKLRVFMKGLKKSRSNSNGPEKPESTNGSQQTPQQEQPEKVENKQGKLFTVKLKVEEVPIVSLFTRDNSSRISTKAAQNNKSQISEETAASEEKRFSKEVVQKYLKMVKPLYVRVSKRKTVSGPQPAENSQAEGEVVTEAAPAASNVRSLKQGNIPAGLRVVCKHLGKSRSASSAVAAAPAGTVPSQRRDDSLLQQQDGIQSAILHCKRSFNASRDSDYTPLSRSESDSSNENASQKPSDQGREV